jgi:uncharacterized protein
VVAAGQPVSRFGYHRALAAGQHMVDGEQLAAITSGLAGLMQGAAQVSGAGPPTRALADMDGGLMLVKMISDGSSLAVLAAPGCDTELVSYEVTLLVEAAGEALTPAARGPRRPGTRIAGGEPA